MIKILIALLRYNTKQKLDKSNLRALVIYGCHGKAHKAAEYAYLHYNQ